MTQVNIFEAKTQLSKLVEAVETGREGEIILARNGKPVARIVPLVGKADTSANRLGSAEGQFGPLDDAWFEAFQSLDAVVWGGFSEGQPDAPAPQTRKRAKRSPP